MNDMTVRGFCKKHGACEDGVAWCRENDLLNGKMSVLWERTDLPPEFRSWIATRNGVLSDRDVRLYACWCVRQVWHLLTKTRSRRAVEVSERYAVGEATKDELSTAQTEAYKAIWRTDAPRSSEWWMEVARSAARSAAWSAAWSAAIEAATEAATWSAVAAQAEARSAAEARAAKAAAKAADAAAKAADAAAKAADAAAEEAQAAWLRESGNPFGG